MKFIDKKLTKKVKEEKVKEPKIPPITKKEQASVDEFFVKHAKHMRTLGCVTSAWFGLQWGSCPDYTHVACGCGMVYIQKTPHSEPVCTFEESAKTQTKISGEPIE